MSSSSHCIFCYIFIVIFIFLLLFLLCYAIKMQILSRQNYNTRCARSRILLHFVLFLLLCYMLFCYIFIVIFYYISLCFVVFLLFHLFLINFFTWNKNSHCRNDNREREDLILPKPVEAFAQRTSSALGWWNRSDCNHLSI